MKSSCISHPKNEQYVIIHQWQTEFCEGNQCAAALLSYFEYWHNRKLITAEQQGEGRTLSENVCQSHTLQELSAGMLGLFGRSAIIYALKWLENKNAITILSKSNLKESFNKAKTYRFNPDVCNYWLKQQKLCSSTVNYRENTPKLNEKSTMLSFNEIVPQVDEKSKEMIQNIAEALMQISKYHFSSI